MSTTVAPAQDQSPSTPPRRRSRLAVLAGSVFGGYLPLLVATLVIGLPLLWMILSSFKQRSEIISVQMHWLPATFMISNYTEAFQQVPFVRVFFNSVLVTVIGAGVKVILAIITAYALVFVRFPFKKTLFMIILVGLMVPAQISILPNYILIAGLGGKNTYWGIIVPGLGTAFGTFLLRQNFMTFPRAVIEAAEIDGASHFKRMTRVVIPVQFPAIATLTLIYLVLEWNEYIWPLVIIDDPAHMTLPVGLTLLQNSEPGSSAWGVMMAGAVLVIAPILIVFAALQKYIVTGLTQGAVK